jgi:hypothetical protein
MMDHAVISNEQVN